MANTIILDKSNLVKYIVYICSFLCEMVNLKRFFFFVMAEVRTPDLIYIYYILSLPTELSIQFTFSEMIIKKRERKFHLAGWLPTSKLLELFVPKSKGL